MSVFFMMTIGPGHFLGIFLYKRLYVVSGGALVSALVSYFVGSGFESSGSWSGL